MVAALARVCPSVTDRIVARRVRTPTDLAADLSLSGGHVHHGEHAFDQLLCMRPSVDCAQYTTPIAGLYLCGSGVHPGGGITCAPGALSRRQYCR